MRTITYLAIHILKKIYLVFNGRHSYRFGTYFNVLTDIIINYHFSHSVNCHILNITFKVNNFFIY